MKRNVVALVCLFVFVFVLILPVYATEPELPTKSNLQVEFPHTGTLFELYRVATASSSGVYSPTEDFVECPVDLSNAQGDASKATILESYVRLWELEPTYSNPVGWGDYANFDQVDDGLYLVVSRHITTHGMTYKAQPLLLAIPGRDAEEGTPVYQLSVAPKVLMVPPDYTETLSRKVMKVWDIQDQSIVLPDSVTIYLLCDGVKYDTKILNDENNWSYRWDGLDPNHMWEIVEEPIDNYLVSIEKKGITFVVTNTYTEEEPSSNPTTSTDPTTSTEPTATTPSSGGEDDDKLPQTGVLWWPVPVLALSGMVVFVFGWFLSRRERDE